MRKIALLCVLAAFCSIAYGQKGTETKITEALGSEYLAHIKANNPTLIDYYDFIINESYEIAFYGEEKAMQAGVNVLEINKEQQGKELSTPLSKDTDLNILLYNYTINPKTRKIYRLDNSGYVLIFYSAKELTKKYSLRK